VEYARFGTIAQKVDDNHYGVIIKGGIRVEATYYRTTIATDFDVGTPVFLEKVPGSDLWMISSLAIGNPSDPTNRGWFEIDHDTYGVVDGPGRIVP